MLRESPRSLSLLVVFALLFGATPGSSQDRRSELGRRMLAFEELWEVTDAPGRLRANEHLDAATRRFLSFRLASAAESLDRARLALLGEETPTTALRAALALSFRPERRLVDASEAALAIRVAPVYTVAEAPGLVAVLSLPGAAPVEAAIPPEGEAVIELPLPEKAAGDLALEIRIGTGEESLALRRLRFSRVPDLASRLAALATPEAKDEDPDPLARATLEDRRRLLVRLADGKEHETDVAASALLAECESIVAALESGRRWTGCEEPGDHSLTIPLGKRSVACRLSVPPRAPRRSAAPLVIALHGMGGSENLFFEGYGRGLAVDLARERGWFLVAPRLPLLGGGPDLEDLVDALRERFPIDPRRVVIVGHSMGAARALDAAAKAPGRFRALGLLGGGRPRDDLAALKELAVHVGVGELDFAREGALALHAALLKAGVRGAHLDVHPGVEHMVIVRAALPAVFRTFDAALAPPATAPVDGGGEGGDR